MEAQLDAAEADLERERSLNVSIRQARPLTTLPTLSSPACTPGMRKDLVEQPRANMRAA